MNRLWGIAAIIFIGTGCAPGPKYPLLGEQYETVIFGEIVSVSDPQPHLFLGDEGMIPKSSIPENVYFKYRRTGIAVSYVDVCDSAIPVAAGDTIPVMCLADYKSVPFGQDGESRIISVGQWRVIEWEVGEVGIFLICSVDGNWLPQGFRNEEAYREADYLRKETERYENLTPESKFE